MINMKKAPARIVVGFLLAIASPVHSQETGGIKPAPIDLKGLPTGLLTEEAPSGPIASPKIVREKAKKGDRVSITGRVGGSAVPWVKDRAMFTIVGDELESCSDHGMDGCPQPWDYCCEPKTEISRCSATVQIVDAKSKLLKVGMKGKAGLIELSDVTVTGIVQSVDDKTFVIAAESMYVWPSLPNGWAVGNAPEDAKSPAQLRAVAQTGDEIAVRGRIGGSEDPIETGVASFTLIGNEVKYAADAPNPWNYPGVAKETIDANSCSIRFVDADGNSLRVELEGRRNVAAGAEVVVLGIVAKNDASGLVIHAQKVVKP